ncbi:transcriptional regulator SplA domain-containing protein [Bacillus sp. JCM 19034]|uniref:transcriptional regulator SplA domain-containing protein n=1 Tax=Bacillus sp. JCM 19034 TaxID=1481928 RepID=UPI00078458DE|nr:transcriptional regulator SplA domain-containing protein [Bacillus sp. JCM 19034]
MLSIDELEEGQQVYVIYENPHTPSVSTIQEAMIARDPDDPERLTLLFRDFYHPIEEDDAIFATYESAELLYNQLSM